MKKRGNTTFLVSLGSLPLNPHKLDTLAKTISFNSTANDHASDNQHKKVEKFLKVFFTNYTTNQDNLNLIAKNVAIVANTTFKTIDYTYLKKDGANLIAYVQATFEVGGTTHSENFTFTLSEKEKSYYVTKLEHTIPLNYANDKE